MCDVEKMEICVMIVSEKNGGSTDTNCQATCLLNWSANISYFTMY